MRRRISEADIARAEAAEEAAAATELRATGVRYVPETDRIEMLLRDGLALSFPRSASPDFAACPAEEMEGLEAWPGGSILVVESQDVHVSAHGLASRLLGIAPEQAKPRTAFAVEAVPLAGRRTESGLLSLHGCFGGMRAAFRATVARLEGSGWAAGRGAEASEHGEARLEAEMSKGKARILLTGSEWFVHDAEDAA